MLHSSYNVNRLGSPTAGDLINTSVFDTAGGNANYFGTSTPFIACGAANCSASMYPTGNTMSQMLTPAPLPRRRYSLGALPSASGTDDADIAHVTNLLNEAKTSITRSSQILYRGENLTDDILMSSAAGDVLAEIQRLNETSDVDITGANILNQMRLGYSSQPNIYYAQPNYTYSQMPSDLYLSRMKRLPYDRSTANHTAMYAKPPLPNPILTAYTNPYFAGMHTTATNMPSTLTNPYTSYQPQTYQTYQTKVYNQPPPPYSSVLFPSTQLHQPLPLPLSATNYHHPHHYHQHYPHRPIHHTSNPVISQSSTAYYTKHLHPSHDAHSMHAHNMGHTMCSGSMAMPSATGSGGIAQTSTSASYLRHHNQHPYCGYSNQHFDLHNLNSNSCYPKLDLVDYTKQGEHTKRQVSFNVDVDTLSITS